MDSIFTSILWAVLLLLLLISFMIRLIKMEEDMIVYFREVEVLNDILDKTVDIRNARE